MYKILIVDDEALIREAITEQMNWAELGFQCVGGCEDGLEALEWVEKELPDVVMTDICMPFMDGLELTQELSIQYPSIKVIILTGFDDFVYAQQALKLQAYDFILKPVTMEELRGVLKSLKRELDVESSKKKDLVQLKQQLRESLPILKERFLERLVTSPIPEKERIERCEYFQLEWSGPYFLELAVRVDWQSLSFPATSNDYELLSFAVYNIAQEITANSLGTVVFRDCNSHVLILLSSAAAEQLREEGMRLAEEIRHAVARYLPVTVSIGIGHTCWQLSNITSAHQSAISALDYRFIIGPNEVIRLSDMEQRQRPALLSAVDWEKELITKLKTGTPQQLDEWVGGMFDVFREHVFPLDACHLYIQRIVLSMLHMVYEMGSNASDFLEEVDGPLIKLNRFAALDELEQWMKDLSGFAASAIKSSRENYSSLQVHKAIEYVKQHYHDSELSLTAVCKHVSMSVSYFSTLFKQHTGKTFVEFVTLERMEKAKELLKLSAMKSSEIAYEVGYSDPHYFSGAFKKHTGDTPTEYRNKMTMGKV